MKQLAQLLRNGQMSALEVPMPVVGNHSVLVRNYFSLISAGTEGSTVTTARKSLLGKALERPQQVQQVFEVVQQQGPLAAYRAVSKKLEAYSPLGYSSAGVVAGVGGKVGRFAAGDRVACAGVGYANHAEFVAVPQNLCVRLAADADLKRACYNTLGAIALQGVRQADLRLGESCAVIGLGLIGQLTCLLLRAAGVRVLGIDVEESPVHLARAHCAEAAWIRATPGLESLIEGATGGLGADAVVITAATDSLDPINLAGRIARKRGTVVVVGDVPTGFERNPHWYRKELQLRMSCSYGPGRYDPEYEEKGRDYPPGYVRWTEKRNMEAFQELIHSGRLNLDYLTTHEVSLAEAPKAYDMIVNRSEPHLGIVIRYDVSQPTEGKPVAAVVAADRQAAAEPGTAPGAVASGRVGLAFIGAGSYAQGMLLPNLPADSAVERVAVLTQSGTTSRRVAERFGFQAATAAEADIFGNDRVNTVFVASRHDSHAEYVLKALRAGKHVFVEKPLCVALEELAEIEAETGKQKAETPSPLLLVGFNRRFSPLSALLKSRLSKAPVAMLCRVNAGAIPAEHWIQDPEFGGGRIVGEACHFIDLLTYFAGSLPKTVFASALPDAKTLADTVAINLEFENGSVGTVMYYGNGCKAMPKEHIEVYQAGQTGVIEDFRRLTVWGGRRPLKKRFWNQDKGQKEMVRRFLRQVSEGGVPLIPPAELIAVTRTTFAVLESLRSRRSVDVANR